MFILLNRSGKKLLLALSIFATHAVYAEKISYPQDQTLYDNYPFSVLFYHGLTVNNPLVETVTLDNLKRWPEHIESFEFAYTLNQKNILRRLVNPLVGVVQIASNATIRYDRDDRTIYEFDPYLMFRWANVAWNKTVNTSFALGEGVSYTSSVPSIEKKENKNTKRLLNYLMFEITAANPAHPKLQFVIRVHHRSGAYGLYHAGNTGSNDIGFGVRYLFD